MAMIATLWWLWLTLTVVGLVAMVWDAAFYDPPGPVGFERHHGPVGCLGGMVFFAGMLPLGLCMWRWLVLFVIS